MVLFSDTVRLQQVMALVELTPLRDLLVGNPGGTGLSIEQRKRYSLPALASIGMSGYSVLGNVEKRLLGSGPPSFSRHHWV